MLRPNPKRDPRLTPCLTLTPTNQALPGPARRLHAQTQWVLIGSLHSARSQIQERCACATPLPGALVPACGWCTKRKRSSARMCAQHCTVALTALCRTLKILHSLHVHCMLRNTELEEALGLGGVLERVEPLEHGAARPSELRLEPREALEGRLPFSLPFSLPLRRRTVA